MIKIKTVIFTMAIIAIAIFAVTRIKAVYNGTSVTDETIRSNQKMLNAAKNGDIVQLEQPDEKRVSATSQTNELNQEMIIAASNGNLEKVQQLVDKGADINAVGNGLMAGYTALTIAAINGHLEIVKFLVDKGVDVNAFGEDGAPRGHTALTLAAEEGHLEIVEFLVEKGADVNATPRDVALGHTALHWASKRQHWDIVRFLVENGADVNASATGEYGSGITALLYASCGGNLDIVKFLVEKGADVNAVTNNSISKGEAALMEAAGSGHLEIVKFLVENGADINAIATINSKVYTALTIASERAHSDVVQFLVENGADIDAVSREEKTSQGSDVERTNTEVSNELEPDKVKSNVEVSIGLKKKTINLGADITMELVYIPAGEFMMGSHSDANMGSIGYNERPQHQVKISKGFWMGIYEVTNGQYQQFLKDSNYDGEREANANYLRHILLTPDYNTPEEGSDYPVVWVSWNNARAFCEWLSVKESKTYRLPTEAQWEYACRAGRPKELDIKDDGLFLKSSGGRASSMRGTHSVGQNKPNSFGLYDMYDNVREWCLDWYGSYSNTTEVDPKGPSSGDKRVVRGDYSGNIISYRCAKRFCYPPDKPDNKIGFRIVCVDQQEK